MNKIDKNKSKIKNKFVKEKVFKIWKLFFLKKKKRIFNYLKSIKFEKMMKKRKAFKILKENYKKKK